MSKKIIPIILLNLLSSNFLIFPALAQFDPNFIISDAELTNHNSMNMGQIQNFLQNKGSYLASYVDPNLRITAAQAIYDAAHLHKINPKYLFVTLQKEQSLIEGGTPTQSQLDWATGYGLCDDCKKTDAKVQKYKGFTNQVDWGAGAIRYYLDNPNKFIYQVGNTYNIDNVQVTIQNDATRALYLYTPHLHGNENFHKIWQKWFATTLLDGTLVQNTKDGGIYLIRDNKKLPFLSKTAYLSRYESFAKVIPADPIDLAKYPTGTAIKYPNYSLLQVPTGGIYLLNDDTLQPIASKEAFRLLGFNPEEVIPVESSDIFFYKIGKPITAKSAYPTGGLLQNNSTGGIYYVENGIKHPIPARDLMNLYYSNKKVTPVSPEELTKYDTGEAIKLHDGELVTSPNDQTVYIITDGQKRPFDSAETFLGLGYKFSNVFTVSENVLKLHDTGDPITLNK